MKKYFNYFIYVSIIFLIISLIRSDYLTVPMIYSVPYLILSVVFLFIAFILDATAWKKLVDLTISRISLGSAISSMGLSIFGKYIPGKIWVISGRAAYIGKKYSLSETDLLIHSVNAQLIYIIAGSFFAGIGFLYIGDLMLKLAFMLILSLSVFIVFYSKIYIKMLSFVLNKILKKNLSIPSLKHRTSFIVLFWYMIHWSFISLSFYFLSRALVIDNILFVTCFAFAIGNIIGLVALIAPGGLGVREGVIFSFLIAVGFTSQNAIIVSVNSRIWYLLGEFFIFFVGFMISRINNQLQSKI
jgi:glycosyltransferase 2 family protein